MLSKPQHSSAGSHSALYPQQTAGLPDPLGTLPVALPLPAAGLLAFGPVPSMWVLGAPFLPVPGHASF